MSGSEADSWDALCFWTLFQASWRCLLRFEPPTAGCSLQRRPDTATRGSSSAVQLLEERSAAANVKSSSMVC